MSFFNVIRILILIIDISHMIQKITQMYSIIERLPNNIWDYNKHYKTAGRVIRNNITCLLALEGYPMVVK